MGKHLQYWSSKNQKLFTVKQASSLPECVVSSVTLSARLHNGWSLDRAMTTPVGAIRKPFIVEWNGEKVSGQELVEREGVEGLTCKMFYARVEQNGWNVDKALHTPLLKRKRTIAPEGYETEVDFLGEKKTIYELSEMECCVVPIRTLYQRIIIYKMNVYTAMVRHPNSQYKDPFTKEEREYWDEWLCTPIETIKERAMEYWEDKPMKGLYNQGMKPCAGWGEQCK